MEIFSTNFINSALAKLASVTADGGSITSEKLCVALEVDPVFVPAVRLLLELPDFAQYESAKRAGIRRVKVSAPVTVTESATVSDPLAIVEPIAIPSEPGPVTLTPEAVSQVTEPEPSPEPESETEAELDELEAIMDEREADQLPEPKVKPVLKIVGTDGNAFMLMGIASRVARKNGMDWDTILEELTAGDYDELLATLCKYFDVQ